MGDKKKELELDAQSLPPYTENEVRLTTEKDAALAPTQTCRTRKIPSPINFYTGWSKYWLGRHQDEKIFAASFGWGCFGRSVITLYDGPTKRDPVLVTSRHKGGKYIMTIPDSSSSISVKGGKVKGPGQDIPFHCGGNTSRFSIKVGEGLPHTEDFEWRRTHGEEIKALAPHTCGGWKLVRTSVPPGEGAVRGNGVTSDGLEVVAVVARNAGWSKNKSAYVCFMNSGLDGSLGQPWELAATLSGLILWWQNFMASAASAGAAV